MALNERLSALTPEQRALFEKLREQQKKQKPAPLKAPQPPGIARRGPGDHWPLSFDQERLWFLYMLNPEDSAYNIDTASRIRGLVDFAALEGAFQEIARRHEIWRTAFPSVDGRPVQVVLPEMHLPSLIVDLRGLPREIRERTAHGLMVASTRVPFRLETGPMVRALLLRLDDEDCICHLIVHHIVTDWVTFQLFWREIGLLYEASIAGQPSPLPPPVVQFADYTAWQREWMSGEVEQFFLRYWVENLRDAPLALEVPTDRPRPPVQTSNGWRVEVRVERAAEVKSLARREGLTPFMAMLAAYQIVLARWSGQDKVIVGSPNANRNRLEIAEIFGFFLTQLPFCNDFSGEPTLREALRRTREMALAAYAHQDLPFGKLVEALHPERDLSRAPIIQVVLLLLDGAVLSPKLADLELEPVDVHDGNARYDVMFAMWDHPNLIHGWYEYNSDLWDEPTAARLVQGVYRVLDAMLADPEQRLGDLAYVSPAEARQVLAEWNDTARSYPTGTLHGLIAAQAARTPDALAASYEGESLTYAELERRAQGLAHHLIHLGVLPDAPVGVLMERSLDMIVGLLGVLKAGAAYVPLDPTYPAERLALMVESAGMPVALAEERFTYLLSSNPRLTVLSPPLPEAGEGVGEGAGGEGHAAYVIYTSGSTGTPKGVVVPHQGIVNRLLWMQEAYGLTPEDRVLQKTPFGFDVSVWEFFWPLLTGARLVFARPEGHRDPAYLAELIAREGITTLHFVPSMLQLFLEAPGLSELSSLRRVMVSGEALPPEMVCRFQALLPGVELHNLYGPTEASVDVSFWAAEPNPRRVPIGRPIANLRLHMVDRHLRSQPIGVPGELLLGGVGLARGYLGRPELTAAAFVPDPFGAEPGGRLYRTGDLARTWADGNVEFLGRIDHQVKIRGVRIELGEVEAALDRHPAVGESVAVARDGALVAYVVGRDGLVPDPEELRRFLLERLPEAMVPSAFMVLDRLPLTGSGKVDRRALPALEAGRTTAAIAYEAPRNADEELLVELWDKVLGTGQTGIRDHFFHLGGHSLLATRLTLYIRDAFQVDLPVRAIFQAPTVAAQAELIAGLRAGGATVADTGPIPHLPRESWPLRAPLSFAQERLWFINRLMPGNPAYNLGVALRLDGRLDTGALAAAFAALIERHETLRTTFSEQEGRPMQEVASELDFRLQEIDLSGAADPEADVRRLAEADAVRPIDLSAGPLLRATVLRLSAERHVLLLAMHHIVSDAWSMGVLIEDLTALYSGRQLAPLPVQYADYTVWQRERLSGGEIDRQLAYWREQLAGAPRILELPTDLPRPAVQSMRGGMVPFEIEAGTKAALADLARRTGSTLYMVLLSGWASLLARLADQQDLVLGTAVANRDRAEVERLIGYFVNTLAMRIDLTGDPSFEELLGRLRHRVLDAFAHRDLPFEKLVEELRPARDRSRQPLFQVMLTFQNVPQGRADLSELSLSPVAVAGQTTKFDLTLTLFEEDGHLQGRLEYASDLFDAATAERWTGAFRRLLAGAATAPETRVAELPWLTGPEREQLLTGWNRAGNVLELAAGRGRRSLVALFEEQADRRPEAPAVSLGAGRLTYRELDERANRLARHLAAAGVRPGDRVALCLERSLEMVVALLGVLKAGAAYVPLDPAYPAERLAFALEDSGAALVVSAGELAGELPVRALLLDREADAIAQHSPARPALEIDPELPAYVIYTSGSTGRPKGVVVPHGNVTRLFSATEGWFGFDPEDVWTLFHSYAFDFSVWEIWGALLYGGRLVIVPFWESRNPESFLRLLHAEGVTVLNQTPSAFRQLLWAEEATLAGGAPLEDIALRWVIFGGEALEPAMLEPWFQRHGEERPRLVNMYGITETTVHVTFRPLGAQDVAAPGSLVGQPIPDLTLHVLDRRLGLQPVGVPGEICVGGEGLAQGYLGRPELTAERFVPDPWGAPGARLYRSGDLARRRPDGDLEYLGRIDQQVKIRGFRIEPGEVEAALAQHPAVRAAAVLARDIPGNLSGNQGGKVLVAYAVLAETVPATELQSFLRERLPEPMLPAAWVFLEALPLTPNGKVDRRALAALEVGATRSVVEHVAPRTPLEERLVETVAGVLGLEPGRIGVFDNFFDLGGHSLLATQLVAQLRLHHGIDVPLQLLFDSAHLADLADRVTERELAETDDALLAEMLAELEESE